MNSIRSIAKNFITLSLAQLVSTGLSLVLVILITRFIGDVGYGQFSFAMSLAATLTVLTPLGLDQLIVREVARHKEAAAKYLGNALVIGLVLGALFLGVLAPIALLIHLPAESAVVLYLASAYYVCINLSATMKGLFRAYERMEYDALLTSGRNILTATTVAAVLLLGYSLYAVATAYVLAAVVELGATLFVSLRRFVKPKLELDLTFIKHILPAALPFALMALVIATYTQIDVILLGVLRDDATVGWYKAGIAVISAFTNIPIILSSTIFPVMSRFHISAKRSLALTLQKSAKFLLVLGLPITAGLILLAEPIMTKFFGLVFLPAVPSLRILAIFVPFSFLNSILGVTFASIGKQHLRLTFYLLSTLVRVVLMYFFVTRLSLTGAAIAIVASEALLFALNYFVSARLVERLRLERMIPKPLLASLGMAFFVFFSRGMNLFLLVLLAALLYFGLFYVIGGIDAGDRVIIRGFRKQIGIVEPPFSRK
jgi:O-antigen/teichoic acid export membrane protein